MNKKNLGPCLLPGVEKLKPEERLINSFLSDGRKLIFLSRLCQKFKDHITRCYIIESAFK